MKKKLMILPALLALLAAKPVMAENIGDVTGFVVYSNLDTYVNNYPINAYNLNDHQLICAEDLRSFGFDVIWNEKERTLDISPSSGNPEITRDNSIKREYYLQLRRAFDTLFTDIRVRLNGTEIESYAVNGKMMIPVRSLEGLGHCEYSGAESYSKIFIDGLPIAEYEPPEISYDKKIAVVLDAGHGKSSYAMSDEEKISEGYTLRSGGWGEWRHWKNGSADIECEGSGCRGDHSCWYVIGNGDRDIEPDINLQNTLSAKQYLENELGYEVRLTRSSNDENPSFSKRVSYCYPSRDMSREPDAAVYVCIHSNAGGGRGSAYIEAEGGYTQKWIKNNYTGESNRLGELINNRIVSETGLSRHGSGVIGGEGYLILFNKCPIPAGYMEIGFFDSSDLGILRTEHDGIGKAIAYGINDYMTLR